MKERLTLHIECGETTCASKPGRFCQYLQTRRFGTVYFCRIFHDYDAQGHPLPADEKDGYVMRHDECIIAGAFPDIERITQYGPDRVVVHESGRAVPPRSAREQYDITPTVIFIRNDGWSLGAPEIYRHIAERMWSDVYRIVLTWDKKTWHPRVVR